ncbi:skp1 family, dimerization domain-containing protein [Ditylenchus destructor]|nr:skp1 family, dimerization domain-containing protein [Ditylenchus destructor]
MESEEAGPVSSNQMVVCNTANGDIIHVEIEVMNQSQTFKEAVEKPDFAVFSAQEVKTPVLIKIVDWCRQRIGVPEPVSRVDRRTGERIWFKLTDYEKKFFRELPNAELIEVLESAKYLQIESLYLYSCQTMAYRMKRMDCEEIRQTFGLEDDLTLKEKAQIRRKNNGRRAKGGRT